MARRAKVLAPKVDDLRSILRPTGWRTDSCRLSSALHVCAVEHPHPKTSDMCNIILEEHGF